MAVTMKNAVFWDVAAVTCSIWFLARGFFYPEDGGDMFFRNVGLHTIYTVPCPRRRNSAYIQIIRKFCFIAETNILRALNL
jgi:hypothetical protein